MNIGDRVDVHFDDGCKIGVLVSDEGETVSVSFGTIMGSDITIEGIPKERVTKWGK